LIAFLALAIAVPAVSQEITGSIVGNVVDSAGLAMPGVTVTVADTGRNLVVRTLKTDGEGAFVATLLPIGSYSLKAERQGFKQAVETGIELHVNDRLTFRLKMEVGAVTDQITVEASAVNVELQSPVVSSLIDGTEIAELSLNNRNYLQLVQMLPGITTSQQSDELYVGSTNPLGGTNTIPFYVNGARASGSNYTVDGADNVDRGSNLTLLAYPNQDTIAELKVVRGQYSADTGRAGAGQISVVTKSGARKFHGTAFETFKNDALAANNYFNNMRGINVVDGKAKVPPLRNNNFGYTFSGPVPVLGRKGSDRHKTFFFWAQEFRRVITYTTFQATVPTDDLKKGVFTAPVCIATSGSTCTATATTIPASLINPVSAAYVQDIWSKIPAGDAGTFNLYTPQRNLNNFREEMVKIDHVLSSKHAAYVRFLRDTIPSVEPGGLFVGNFVPGVAVSSTNSPGRSWVARLTSTLSTSMMNEAGFNYSYGAIISRPTGLIGKAQSPDIKPNLPFPVTQARNPTMSVSGFSSLTGVGPYDDFNRNYAFFDNFTKLRGKHQIRIGFTANLYQKTENSSGSNNVGTFSTTNTPRPTGTATTLQSWANFLLGNASQFTQASVDLTPNEHVRQFEVYSQDDIRLTRYLTVNVGVRMSNFYQPYDSNHLLTNFDPSRYDPAKAPQLNATAGTIVPGTGDPLNGIVVNGQNSRYGAKASGEDLWKLAPRVGFAWDPFHTGKTAVRAGYGISYDSTLVGIFEQNTFANPPYVNSVTITNTKFDTLGAGTQVASTSVKTLHGTPLPAALPYTQQWSFDIQQRIGRSFIATAGYTGTKGTHLLGIVDLNQVPPGLAYASKVVTGPVTSTTNPLLNQLRPYRGYLYVNSLENWFNSNYHSLQTSLQKQFSARSSLRVAYTFSKVLTGATSDRSNAPQNTYNRAAEYARASFDRTHVLNVSYIYRLPLMPHSKGVVGALFKGWQLTGVASFNSGLPTRATSSLGYDWAGLGLIGSSVTIRPDMVGNPNHNAPHTFDKWFNTAAFAAVPAGQIRPGNAPATCIIGPGYQRWDATLSKSWILREPGMSLKVQVDAFNLPNHTNPYGFSAALGSSNYGQVTSTRDSRKIVLAARLSF
jgi:hypothetical protein